MKIYQTTCTNFGYAKPRIVSRPTTKPIENTSIHNAIMQAAQKFGYQFGMKDLIKQNPEVIKLMSEATNSKGELLFDAEDICGFLYNSKHAFGTNKPISNCQAKVQAVLADPEERNFISCFKSKGYGLFNQVLYPEKSVRTAHPELFGK